MNTIQTKAGTIQALTEQPEYLIMALEALRDGNNSRSAELLECVIDVLTIEHEMIVNNWAGAPIADAAYTQKLQRLGEL